MEADEKKGVERYWEGFVTTHGAYGTDLWACARWMSVTDETGRLTEVFPYLKYCRIARLEMMPRPVLASSPSSIRRSVRRISPIVTFRAPNE